MVSLVRVLVELQALLCESQANLRILRLSGTWTEKSIRVGHFLLCSGSPINKVFCIWLQGIPVAQRAVLAFRTVHRFFYAA
jgi:hypothetical protein